MDDDIELISLGETLSVVLFQCFLSENNTLAKTVEAIDIIHNIDDNYDIMTISGNLSSLLYNNYINLQYLTILDFTIIWIFEVF